LPIQPLTNSHIRNKDFDKILIINEVKKMNSHTVLNSNSKFECQRCSKKQIVTDFGIGEIFCANCGFVIDDEMENSGYDSSLGDNHKDNRRTVMPITLSRNAFGLSTVISSENKDAHG